MTIAFHPLADLFPLIEGSEFAELVASIKANGLREEITMFDGSILDGRNRYRACERAGVEPRFETYTGDDPVAYVVDKNITRRHLNESQRALIAAKIATRKKGGHGGYSDSDKSESPSPTVAQASKMLNVSIDSISAARRVLAEGTPEEIDAVKQGKAAVSTIARQLRANVAPEKRGKKPPHRGPKGHLGKNPERIETIRANAKIWGTLREGLTALTSLPMPEDVVPIAQQFNRGGFLESRLAKTIKYLKDFENEWIQRVKTSTAQKQDASDYRDAGTSN